MKKTLFYTGTILLIIWLAGFFLFQAPPEIHALLMLSLILLIRSSFIYSQPQDRVPGTAG